MSEKSERGLRLSNFIPVTAKYLQSNSTLSTFLIHYHYTKKNMSKFRIGRCMESPTSNDVLNALRTSPGQLLENEKFIVHQMPIWKAK